MRGKFYSAGDDLPEDDIRELSDLLAAQLYGRMDSKVYSLSRHDVAELIVPYVEDLSPDDQRSIAWLIWDLFQEGLKIEMQQRRGR